MYILPINSVSSMIISVAWVHCLQNLGFYDNFYDETNVFVYLQSNLLLDGLDLSL